MKPTPNTLCEYIGATPVKLLNKNLVGVMDLYAFATQTHWNGPERGLIAIQELEHRTLALVPYYKTVVTAANWPVRQRAFLASFLLFIGRSRAGSTLSDRIAICANEGEANR